MVQRSCLRRHAILYLRYDWQRQTSGRYIPVPLPGSVYSFAVMYEVGGGGDVVALRLITYRCVS